MQTTLESIITDINNDKIRAEYLSNNHKNIEAQLKYRGQVAAYEYALSLLKKLKGR